jgi:hypothetical protein
MATLPAKDNDTVNINASPTYVAPLTWEGGPAIMQQHVCLLECVSATVLDELLNGTALKNFVVRRISPTCLVIDQQRTEEIIKFLTKRGYEPKVLQQL